MADWSEKARPDTRYRPQTRVSRLLLGISDSTLLASTMSAPPSSFLLHTQQSPTPLPPPPDDEPPRGQWDEGPRPSEARPLSEEGRAPNCWDEINASETGLERTEATKTGHHDAVWCRVKEMAGGYVLRPLGIRFADQVTAFPAGINAGATWDRDMIRRRGEAMACKLKGKGVPVALRPMMKLGRVAAGERNWEGFGVDPYHVGEASYETIIGIQDEGVQACAKHYINNEQEHYHATSSSNVDDRTQHELYAHPFLRSVMAGAASVMCSHKQRLDHILQYATALGHMTMPGDIAFRSNDSYFGANSTAAVKNGEVTEDRVTDTTERIVAAWYLVGQDKGYPDINSDSFRLQDPINKHVDVQADHYKLVREVGAASTMLSKNVNDTLPLKKPITIAMIGSDAGPAQRGPSGYADRGGLDGTLAMGWGSGTAEFPYFISPLEAPQQRAKQDHTTIGWWPNDWDTVGAANDAANKDVTLVFVASDSGEQYITVDGNEGDRHNLTASNNILLWASRSSGLVFLNKSLLPYTTAKKPEDYSTYVVRNDPSEQPQIPYTGGLLIDYRWFGAENIEPRYESGLGLSYTTFEYSNLKVTRAEDALSKELIWWDGGVSGNKTGASIGAWLHDALFKVSFTVKNTGKVAGSEVAQLYINPPAGANEPPSVLRGFDKVNLESGESKTVQLALSRYDLSIWGAQRQGWARMNGTVGVWVDSGSRNQILKGTIE
ncbi:Fibronectin type III-like domain, partial [Rhizoctonia solani]